MIPTIKAEFRKLFTVRSTYIMVIISLILIFLFAFWLEGYKGTSGSPASTLAPTALQEIITNGAGLSVLFVSIIAVLFMAHEYRYNTINYTLTVNARRTQVLLAKVFTITVFSLGYGLLAVLTALGFYMLGLSLRDASLPPQDLNILTQVGKLIFYYIGYGLIGLLLAVVTRSIVMSIATLFIFPTTIEPLLGLLLKDNTKYLPFTALDSTVGATMIQNTLTAGTAVLVSTAYLAAGLFVTWWLFVRRDAN
jgi:ABC-2 type transport system permease protein